MKAITIWQPYASLLAIEAKQFETRSWATTYRGPIAIHAAQRPCDTKNMSGLAVHEAINALRPITAPKAKTCMYLPLECLPFGAVVATAELVNCWCIVYNPGADIDAAKNTEVGAELDVSKNHPDFHRFFVPTEKEKLFGNWTAGHYAWEFDNMQMLEEPIPARGRQKLWEWGGKDD